MIAAIRLRGGNAGSARGAASLLAQAIATAKAAGAHGMILVRADSAYYAGAVVSAARRAGAYFSITVVANTAIQAAIAAIPDTAWTAVRYPGAVKDPDTGELISGDGEISVAHAAQRLGCSIGVVYYWIETGQLNARRGSGRRLCILWNDTIEATCRARIATSGHLNPAARRTKPRTRH